MSWYSIGVSRGACEKDSVRGSVQNSRENVAYATYRRKRQAVGPVITTIILLGQRGRYGEEDHCDKGKGNREGAQAKLDWPPTIIIVQPLSCLEGYW